MLLHNKSKIIIKHKLLDKEYSINWKYDNKLSNYQVTIEKYNNGYLYAGYSKQFYLDNLDLLENKLDMFVNIENCAVKSY